MSTILTTAAGYQNFVPQNIDDVRNAILAVIPQSQKVTGARFGGPMPFISVTMDDMQRAIDRASGENNIEMVKALTNLKTAYQAGNPRLEQNGDGRLTVSVYGSHPWFAQGSNPIDELGTFARYTGSQLDGLNQKLDITDFGISAQAVGSYPTVPTTPSSSGIPSTPMVPYCPPATPTTTQPDINIINNFFALLAGLRGSQSYGNSGFNANCLPRPTYNYGNYGGYGSQPYGSAGYNGYNLNVINNFGFSNQQQGLGNLLQGLLNRRYY